MERTLLSLGFDKDEVEELRTLLENFGSDGELVGELVGMAQSGADMEQMLDYASWALDIA